MRLTRFFWYLELAFFIQMSRHNEVVLRRNEAKMESDHPHGAHAVKAISCLDNFWSEGGEDLRGVGR